MNTLNQQDLAELTAKAQAAPRKRSNRNLHPSLDAAVQRLAIAMEPDTYVRPHRHPQTWELYLPLSGALKVIVFDDVGTVLSCDILGDAALGNTTLSNTTLGNTTHGKDTGLKVFELPKNTWHSVVSLQSGSVIFEVKEGPYIQPDAADTAAWSPPENHETVADFQRFLRDAQPGQRYQTSGN